MDGILRLRRCGDAVRGNDASEKTSPGSAGTHVRDLGLVTAFVVRWRYRNREEQRRNNAGNVFGRGFWNVRNTEALSHVDAGGSITTTEHWVQRKHTMDRALESSLLSSPIGGASSGLDDVAHSAQAADTPGAFFAGATA